MSRRRPRHPELRAGQLLRHRRQHLLLGLGEGALGRHAPAGARPAHRADRDRGRRSASRSRSALALLAHRRRGRAADLVVSALVYTFPSIALFQLLVPFTGLTTTTLEIPLVAYTLVILFPNFVAGLDAAPPEVLEAARGMGLTPSQILTRVELPLALPAIIGGLRIAVVSTIAIATIAASDLPRRASATRSSTRSALPTPFKTEIYSAGALAVALALLCDAALVLPAGSSSPGRGRRPR